MTISHTTNSFLTPPLGSSSSGPMGSHDHGSSRLCSSSTDQPRRILRQIYVMKKSKLHTDQKLKEIIKIISNEELKPSIKKETIEFTWKFLTHALQNQNNICQRAAKKRQQTTIKLIKILSSITLENIESFEPKQSASIYKIINKIKRFNVDKKSSNLEIIIKNLEEKIENQITEIDRKSLIFIAHGLVDRKNPSIKLIHLIKDRAFAFIREMSQREQSELAWAFSRLNYPDVDIFKMIIENYKNENSQICIFTMAQVRDYCVDKQMELIWPHWLAESILALDVQSKSIISPLHKTLSNALNKLGVYHINEYVIGTSCIVDIYIPSHHLVIEVDGPHHKNKERLDTAKSAFIVGRGFTLRRLCYKVIGGHSTKTLKNLINEILEGILPSAQQIRAFPPLIQENSSSDTSDDEEVILFNVTAS